MHRRAAKFTLWLLSLGPLGLETVHHVKHLSRLSTDTHVPNIQHTCIELPTYIRLAVVDSNPVRGSRPSLFASLRTLGTALFLAPLLTWYVDKQHHTTCLCPHLSLLASFHPRPKPHRLYLMIIPSSELSTEFSEFSAVYLGLQINPGS